MNGCTNTDFHNELESYSNVILKVIRDVLHSLGMNFERTNAFFFSY